MDFKRVRLPSAAALRFLQRQRSIQSGLVACLVAGTLCAGVLGYWRPTSRLHRVAVVGERRAQAKALAQMESLRLEDAYRQAQTIGTSLEAKLGYLARPADLLQNIGAWARRNRVQVLSQTNEFGTAHGGIAPVFQDLVLVGEYESIKTLFAELRRMASWTDVESVRLEPAGKNQGLVRASVRLVTYQKRGSGWPPPAAPEEN